MVRSPLTRWGTGLAAAAFVLWAGSGWAATAGPAAMVEGGRIVGETSGPAAVFRGIPYAAPPVGALRWRPPQRAAAWSGVRPATRFGPACPQAGGEGVTDIVRYGGAPEPTSEDCLTLNVWAPPGLSGRAPVMVWQSSLVGSGAPP